MSEGLITLPSGALLIGDEWVSSSTAGQYDHIFAGTGRRNATVTMAGPQEIDAAVRLAKKAQRTWVSLHTDTRRDLLFALADAVRDHADEFANINVHDYASPMFISRSAPVALEGYLRYYAGWVDKGHGQSTPVPIYDDVQLIEQEPIGVVGVITPWNGPLFVIGMAVAPALAAGNAVVLKPSELAPLGALRFGELCLEVGLPAGLVSVVPGDGVAGDALVRHKDIGKIHFTGGGATAKLILRAAAENLTPVVTELGGKSADIVFDDADLDQAAHLAAFVGPIVQSGQNCASGSRIFVQDSIYDEFLPKLAAAARSFRIGDPFDDSTMVGPVVTKAAYDRIYATIEQTLERSEGTLLVGGERVGGDLADGFYIPPTIFTDVSNDSAIARTETFGPVASVLRFTTEEEAVALANQSEFGLASYVQTTNLTRAHRVARQIEAGTVWINRFGHIVPTHPYGGYKQSGTGRAGGLEGLREFQQTKTIRIGLS
jgi:acyl-CoA reductase-like NAD-dependent aldehyde dehydrogenase